MCLYDKNHIFFSLLLNQHKGKLSSNPRHYDLQYNSNEQGLKAIIISKRGKIRM